VLLVNARHIKFVPGRKTDVKDAQWIAELLQHGLLKPSFIPEAPQPDLRELVRYRTHLIDERSREVNRVHKVLENANLKLSSVATDGMGVSGRDMLAAIIAGQNDPAALAQLAKGKLRPKIAQLEQALTGRVNDSHRLLLKLHLEHIDDLNAKITPLEQEIDKRLLPFDQDDLLARLQTIPGVGRKIAQVILAEVGSTVSRFPSAAQLASWTDRVPGKNQPGQPRLESQLRRGRPRRWSFPRLLPGRPIPPPCCPPWQKTRRCRHRPFHPGHCLPPYRQRHRLC
jgi:transposase